MPSERLFGGNIEPACIFCQQGRSSPDQVMILCKKHGPVAPGYKCKRFVYDPLKRIPKRHPPLPSYNPEDFDL